jgi:hypothetical protein
MTVRVSPVDTPLVKVAVRTVPSETDVDPATAAKLVLVVPAAMETADGTVM